MVCRTYTLTEEIYNTLTHAIGSLLCAFFFGMLVEKACLPSVSSTTTVGYCIFGVSSMFAYIASSLYHAVSHIESKRKLKMFDHIAIYFLITGTYIPLILSAVIPTNPILGWSFLGLQVVCAVGGVLYKVFSESRYSKISVILYCTLGWSAVVILKPLLSNLSSDTIFWLVAGGVAFSAGVPFYIMKQYKWTHTIWHIFVLIGSICHYMMMFKI